MSGKIDLVSLQVPNALYKQLGERIMEIESTANLTYCYMHRDSMEFCA